MKPELLLKTGIDPALAWLAQHAGIPVTRDARRFLLAIAFQESGLVDRRQIVRGQPTGPAVSFWQGELTGGMILVLKHPTTGPHMRAMCEAFAVDPTPAALWEAMRYNDVLAAGAARLLVYTLPGKLPTLALPGWNQYLSAWRPGIPRNESWAGNWAAADFAVDLVPC